MKKINIMQLDPEEFKDELVSGIISHLQEYYNKLDKTDPEQLLTRKQTADLLQINLTTLWSYTKAGKLHSYNLGNRVYYKKSQNLESLIRSN